MNTDQPRILIVRLSAIGDTVLNVPVLCALRRQFPAATIGWIVEKTSAPLLRGHAALDHLIEVPRGWLKSPSVVWNTVRTMRRIGFDTSLDLQGLTKSAITAWLSGAKRRLGFTKCEFEGREWSTTINNELVEPTADHVVERGLQLLKPLGIERPLVEFHLPHDDAADARMRQFVRQRGLGAGYCVINTGAGWPSKLWPAERYAQVARELGKRRNLPSVVAWAGPQERAAADTIIALAGGHAHIAPPTSLPELAALARRATFFLGSDTGPLHIAAAVGTACVGLYGPMPASRCGPYGAANIALQNVRLDGKVKNRRKLNNETMLAISVTEVTAACEQILDRRAAARERSIPRPHFAASAVAV